MKVLRRKVQRARAKAKRWARQATEFTQRERHLGKQLRGLRRQARGLRIDIAHAKGPRATALEAELVQAQGQIEDLEEQLRVSRKRAARAIYKRRFWRKRARFLGVKLRHRKELQEAKKHEQPELQDWMLNGHEKPRGEETRKFVARAVVHHGLTVTSTIRDYVPAGGSTTSYHLRQICGCAADVAGPMEDMEACQREEFERSEASELFGPINDRWLKSGSPTAGAEGSPLEELHDTHVHEANVP